MLQAINTAVAGVTAAFEGMNRASAKIAREGAAGGDLAANMVSMMQASHDVQANVAVIKTADKTIGTLIDVLA
jgi:hypothetical protein